MRALSGLLSELLCVVRRGASAANVDACECGSRERYYHCERAQPFVGGEENVEAAARKQ